MLKHKQKVKMARKMRSKLETSHTKADPEGGPAYRNIFDTKNWNARKGAKAKKVANKILKAKNKKNGKKN